MKKKLIEMGIILITIIAVWAAYTVFADTNSFFDFENHNCTWNALYSNADFTYETEGNGNNYLRLSYNGNYNRERNYYDVKAIDIAVADKLIQVDYDVMYSEFITARNGEVQLKYRTGPGSTQTAVAARLAIVENNFQIQENSSFKRVKGLNNQNLSIETNHWYSVKLVLNIEENWQSIYIFDRDTNELLSINEYITASSEVSQINMVTFTSRTDMCLDNVRILAPNCEGSYIHGLQYLSTGESSKYYLWGLDSMGNMTTTGAADTVWTIENSHGVVSVDSETGVVTVSNSAYPCKALLKATRIVGDTTYESKFVLNVLQ